MESIEFTYTRGERWRYLWWDERNVTILVAPVVLSMLLLTRVFFEGAGSESALINIMLLACILMPYVFGPLIAHFRYSLRSADSIVVSFSATEIVITYSDETIQAHRIVNLTQMGKSVVFTTPTGVPVLIPKRAFADKHQLERFLVAARKMNSIFPQRPSRIPAGGPQS